MEKMVEAAEEFHKTTRKMEGVMLARVSHRAQVQARGWREFRFKPVEKRPDRDSEKSMSVCAPSEG